ncbi:DUF5330 domain-containing protein [Affinirhizobium pseudoryzae]|uniref:DUF5330 domain-containing protein n=1 Tax=Allorhizobium pseudoryzae TaxID=379684 RepID=UPI0013E9AF00|nr:DUF5330 domain-containing protein [Allorhizobium pseudoryzae]
MWFLIKTSMGFTAVLVALSYFGSQPAPSGQEPASQLQLTDAFVAATGAYTYLQGLCTEKPDVCEKGAETFTAIAFRAREGAKVAYELLDSQLSGTDDKPALAAAAAPGLPMSTGSVASQPMPPKPEALSAAATADAVVTGTVPLPQRRPDR